MFDYVNVIEWLVALLSLIGWARFSTFVASDVKKNLVDQAELPWQIGTISVMFLMLVMWVLMPVFWAALALNIVIAGGGIAAYWVVRVKAMGPEGHLFKETLKTFQKAAHKGGDIRSARQVQLAYLRNDDSPLPLPRHDDPLAAGLSAADEMVIQALVRRAEQAELVPTPEQNAYALNYIVDGVAYNQPAMQRPVAESVIQAFKVLGGLAAEERRRPQSGRFKTRDAGGSLGFWTVQTSGTTAGERLTLIANEKGRWDLKLDALGLGSDQLKDVKEVTGDTQGLVLVASPKGHGRTSTLYALLRAHDAFMNSLAILETHPQAEIEGASLTKFDTRGTDVNFAKTLQSIFLKDPNIVFVSQVPDPQTADTITRFVSDPNSNPKRVYTGLPAGDTLGALEAWLSLNTDKSAAIGSLRLVIAQRLVRILCPTCKIPYQPDEGTLKKLNLPVGRNLQSFKANTAPIVDKKGNRIICPDCGGIGFRGRTGIFEVLVVTNEIKKALKSNAGMNEIKGLARKNNMILLVEHGIRKFASGITAINEVTRVVGDQKRPRGPKAA